jgi:hypothetical protein
LTTTVTVVIISNMNARILVRRRVLLAPTLFVDLVIWELPKPARGSQHPYKYRMALVSEGVCVLRYDNEAGKGDHRHIGDSEEPYVFTTAGRLMDDFFEDVRRWTDEHGQT